MTDRITVIVADRRRSVAELLVLGLRQVSVEATAVCTFGEAARAVGERRRDALVVDVNLLASEAVPLAESPWFRRLDLPVVVVSEGDPSDGLAGAAVRAGVRGWVSTDSSMRHLLTVIHGVLHGETWLPPPLLTQVLDELISVRESLEAEAGRLAELTDREREVLSCLAAGMSRAEIGRHLFLSTNTVRTHVQNLMTKLDVHSSVAAVAIANRLGLPGAQRRGGRHLED